MGGKKSLVVGGLVVVLVILFFAFGGLNMTGFTSKTEFDSDIELLGFDAPVAYWDVPATMICEASACQGVFPQNYFIDECDEQWNSTGYAYDSNNSPLFYYTGILDCGKSNYIYFYRIPGPYIKIAEIEEIISLE